MVLDFPSSPINGQTYDNYYWDASSNAWRSQGSKNGLSQSINQLRTASPITVGSQGERDLLYPSPVQGNSVFRTDLGAVETYYGLYNQSTNPGGRDAAGWYTTNRAGTLVPVKANSVTIASGTGSANSLGQISFSAATSIQLNGLFTNSFTNYRIIFNLTGGASAATDIAFRYGASGTYSATNYSFGGWKVEAAAATGAYTTQNTGQSMIAEVYGPNSQFGYSAIIDISAPYQNLNTHSKAQISCLRSTGMPTHYTISSWHNVIAQYDGIMFFPLAGNFTGTVQVFGYNEK